MSLTNLCIIFIIFIILHDVHTCGEGEFDPTPLLVNKQTDDCIHHYNCLVLLYCIFAIIHNDN